MADQPLVLSSLPIHPHPDIDLRTYSLQVDGLVDRPARFHLSDLLELADDGIDDDFACLEGWTVPAQAWRGVRLMTLLAQVGVQSAARWVQASCADFSLPLALPDAGTALLALSLNGAPLPVEHGAPVRLLVPGGACFTSVKWLDHLELRATPAANTAESIARARLPR